MVVPQGAISFSRFPAKVRLAAALAAFPVFGGISAVIYGIASGY